MREIASFVITKAALSSVTPSLLSLDLYVYSLLILSTMSEHSTAAAEGTSSQALDCDAFVQTLRQARIEVTDRACGKFYPEALLTTCLHLPPPAVIAKWLEDFYAPMRLGQYQIQGFDHGAQNITTHRAYPNRENMIITCTLPLVVWESLQEIKVSRHITLLSKVAENNVVGDPQMTHLLNRAAKRINEVPLREEQLKDDLERVRRSMVDSLHHIPHRFRTFPKVMFTVQLSNDCYPRLLRANHLNHGEPTMEQRHAQVSLKGMDTHDLCNGICLKFIDEIPADEGSTVTLAMIKEFWPYLETTSESYRFVRYIEEPEWDQMFRDEAPVTVHPAASAQESETTSDKKPKREQKQQVSKRRRTKLIKEHPKMPVDDQNNIVTTRRRSARIRKD